MKENGAATRPSTCSREAVLRASGKVQVNGAESQRITTLFPGDSIKTEGDSLANIIAGGSSILVMPNASVIFLGNTVELTQGGNGNRYLGGHVGDGGGSDHRPDDPKAIEIRSRGKRRLCSGGRPSRERYRVVKIRCARHCQISRLPGCLFSDTMVS